MLPHGGRFDSMRDSDDLDAIFRKRAKRLDAIFRKLAKRHLIPERDSVLDLTLRLRINPQEVKAQAAQACDPYADHETRKRNAAFLRNLSDAVKAARPLAHRDFTLAGLALLMFRSYYWRHGCKPSRNELKALVERVWCRGKRRKSIDTGQWRRMLRDDGLEEFFAPVKGSK
jgi:hypothetical protein